jgi:hypothetical protein
MRDVPEGRSSSVQFPFNRVSFVKLASLVTVVTGVVVLIGWQFDSTVLKSVSDDWVSMKPNTAVALLLAGLSLLFLNFVPPEGVTKRFTSS